MADIVLQSSPSISNLIEIQKHSAIGQAKHDSKLTTYSRDSLIIWCDGSVRQDVQVNPQSRRVVCGAGVVWRRQFCSQNWWWRQRAYHIDMEGVEIIDSELYAIQKALEVAMDEVAKRIGLQREDEREDKLVREVKIYSDSKEALDLVERFLASGQSTFESLTGVPHRTYICYRIDHWIYRLAHLFGVKIRLLWVPARRGVLGNQQADTVARHASKMKIQRETASESITLATNDVDDSVPVMEIFEVINNLDGSEDPAESSCLFDVHMEIVAEDQALVKRLKRIKEQVF